MKKDVIIACDFSSTDETVKFLDRLNKIKEGVVACDDISVSVSRPFVKIGMELFYSQGPEIIKILKERGHKVFLDLKLHDIPNTVTHAMRVLGEYGVDMVNVHAAGGIEMMKAAKEGLMLGAARYAEKPKLIAVTQLTSVDEKILNNELLIDRPMEFVVMQYAMNAKNAGLDGVVCSAHEASSIHSVCGDDFVTVTPGIRLKGDEAGDQRRIMTPNDAANAGADYIVVGRSITGAKDPNEAYIRCRQGFIG